MKDMQAQFENRLPKLHLVFRRRMPFFPHAFL
ncbi:hypothetical protein SAMN05216525_1537 [Bradyrhizobium sp. Gha]|nr:hypothetical protein SAMN05216525_1537 [Bradyrhizobium sp. Gha]